MQDPVASDILRIFEGFPQIFFYGFSALFLVLAGFFLVKGILRTRRNSAFKSYQYGVVAPVQYGDRGAESAPEDTFATRLEDMVEAEETYDLAQLMPQARQLGAIANTTFRTAPVLDPASAGVLSLIEQVVQELDGGFRVSVHASLESMVDLSGAGADSVTTKLAMAGVDLKFAVMDRFGRLAVAVDFQGDAKRSRQDYINRSVVIEVLRKAGVWYLEIPQNYSDKDARAQLKSVLAGKDEAEGGAEVA